MNAFDSDIELNSLDEVKELGTIFANSGFFEDAQEASQAVVKILAGQELGIPPMASMRGIDVIDGNTSLSAAMIGTLIKRHPRYDYRLVGCSAQGCKIRFFEDGEPVDDVTFTRQDAADAGLLKQYNFQNYPKDMFFARCLTRGARRHCPDVFIGAIYTPHELGADESPETPEAMPASGDAPALPDGASTEEGSGQTTSKEQKATDQLLGGDGASGDGAPSSEPDGKPDPKEQPLDPSAVRSGNGEGRTSGETMSGEEQRQAREATKQRADANGAPEATISEGQERRLWAIAKDEDEGQAYSEEALRAMIQSEFGYQVHGEDHEGSISDIRREDYDRIIEACRDAGLASRYRAPGTRDMFGEDGPGVPGWRRDLLDTLEEQYDLTSDELERIDVAVDTVCEVMSDQQRHEDRVRHGAALITEVEGETEPRRRAVYGALRRFDVAPLPKDFPHRERLTDASLYTLQQVHDNLRTGDGAYGALTGIAGIGESRAEDIEQAIGHYDFEVLPADGGEPAATETANDPAFAEGVEDEEVPI